MYRQYVVSLNNFITRDFITKVIADKKGEDVFISDACPIADAVIIVTVLSARQMHAIAQEIKKVNRKKTYIEGLDTDWVLIDVGGFLIHLLKPEARVFYHLEDLYNTSNKHFATV